MGGRGKENKDVREWKNIEIDTVSQLFLHGIVATVKKLQRLPFILLLHKSQPAIVPSQFADYNEKDEDNLWRGSQKHRFIIIKLKIQITWVI